MDLIADIGATNSRCALIDSDGQIVATEIFSNSEFSSLDSLFGAYLQSRRADDQPRRAALAIAAPVLSDIVSMVNIDWQFSRTKLQEQLGLSELILINDAAAIAWSIPDLTSMQLQKFGGGEAVPATPVAAIGPGSGLGVAALIPAEDGWTAVAGEGGHASISPITAKETAVAEFIRAKSGHCSSEDLISGKGLVNIYSALTSMESGQTESSITPAEVSSAASAGSPFAVDAREMFFSLLGTAAGNLALTVGARGGVFIGGGIVPKLIDAFADSDFRKRFEDKGKYRSYLQEIPTYVITEPQPALHGLRKLLGYR